MRTARVIPARQRIPNVRLGADDAIAGAVHGYPLRYLRMSVRLFATTDSEGICPVSFDPQ